MSAVACKVCRVRDVQTARLLSWIGVDYLGLHAIDGIPSQHKSVFRHIVSESRSTRQSPGIVLLTKLRARSHIMKLVEEVQPTHLQLHAPWSMRDLAALRSDLDVSGMGEVRMILTVSPTDDNASKYIEGAKRFSDYLLLDHWAGGTGYVVTRDALRTARKSAAPLPVFIAGGLLPENVSECVSDLEPFGVDVQSGVELRGQHGRKDMRRVVDFVSAAGRRPRPFPGLNIDIPPERLTISVALTDIDADAVEGIAANLSAATDLFHLDFSDGSLVPNLTYNTHGAAMLIKLAAPDTPYDVHAFVHACELNSVAKNYLDANPLLRTIFVHIDPRQGLNCDIVRLQVASEEVRSLGISLGLAVQANDNLPAALEALVRFSTDIGISDISVVGSGPNHGIDDFTSSVIPTLRALRAWQTRGNGFGLGIDRQVNIEKATIAARLGAKRFVVGGAILTKVDPLQAFIRFRERVSNA